MESVAQRFGGNIIHQYPTAGKRKGIGNQHNITAFSHFVSPGQIFIVVLLMLGHERMKDILCAGYLSRPEIFHAPVIMEGEDTGQLTFCVHGLQENGIGSRSIRQLPAQFFDVQAVV